MIYEGDRAQAGRNMSGDIQDYTDGQSRQFDKVVNGTVHIVLRTEAGVYAGGVNYIKDSKGQPHPDAITKKSVLWVGARDDEPAPGLGSEFICDTPEEAERKKDRAVFLAEQGANLQEIYLTLLREH